MGIDVISAVNSEMPVAPPSINLLGKRKLSRPKAADATPEAIRKISFIALETPILSLRKAFAN